jgi:hypothetical protein
MPARGGLDLRTVLRRAVGRRYYVAQMDGAIEEGIAGTDGPGLDFSQELLVEPLSVPLDVQFSCWRHSIPGPFRAAANIELQLEGPTQRR